jgi:hypothetical protein
MREVGSPRASGENKLANYASTKEGRNDVDEEDLHVVMPGKIMA